MPHSAALLNSEIKALLNGNVPKFMTTPMETSLHDEDGERLENYLPEPGAATARGRLRRLSPENLESQDRIVALGMSSLRRKGEAGARSAPPEPIPTEPLGRGEIENEIAALADRLCELVITEGDRHDWIGIVQDEQGGAHVRAAGADLYDGGAGIGLFLGFAAAEFNNSRWKRVSANCAEQIAETLQAPILNLGGAFIGGTSRAFALLHYASLFDRPDWSDLAIRRLLEATPLVRRDRLFDIVAGAAGYAAVLLAAYVRTGETALLDAAVTATEHLVSAQVVTEKGTGWPARNSSVPLTGFSHGAAGIGWSLVHIGHLAGRDDLVARGKAAFAYERSVATARGWPDFRNIPGETGPTFALAWCHGAPGIGLSRATLPLQLCGIAEEGEIARSVSAIETSPLAGTDCLCHGELGNLETLTAAGRRMSDSKIGLVAKRRASAAVLRARARGWRCGIAADVVTPGLMTGLAGIGYGLMRTFEIGEVPSLLRIEGPTKAGFRR
jgi:type 2 lantibiotic biosynthesis protein LanM